MVDRLDRFVRVGGAFGGLESFGALTLELVLL